jgi:hypothetical protein
MQALTTILQSIILILCAAIVYAVIKNFDKAVYGMVCVLAVLAVAQIFAVVSDSTDDDKNTSPKSSSEVYVHYKSTEDVDTILSKSFDTFRTGDPHSLQSVVSNDPTHGNVHYVSMDRATSELGLIKKNRDGISITMKAVPTGIQGTVVGEIGTGSTAQTQPIPEQFTKALFYSVRLQQKTPFEQGKPIMVFFQGTMPAGRALWSALWLLGDPNAVDASTAWPSKGELDLLEYSLPELNSAEGTGSKSVISPSVNTVIHACDNVTVIATPYAKIRNWTVAADDYLIHGAGEIEIPYHERYGGLIKEDKPIVGGIGNYKSIKARAGDGISVDVTDTTIQGEKQILQVSKSLTDQLKTTKEDLIIQYLADGEDFGFFETDNPLSGACNGFHYNHGCGMKSDIPFPDDGSLKGVDNPASIGTSVHGTWAFVWDPAQKTLSKYFSTGVERTIKNGTYPTLSSDQLQVSFTDEDKQTQLLRREFKLTVTCGPSNGEQCKTINSHTKRNYVDNVAYLSSADDIGIYTPVVGTFSYTGGTNVCRSCIGNFKGDCTDNFKNLGLVLNTTVCGDIYIDPDNKTGMDYTAGNCLTYAENNQAGIIENGQWTIRSLIARTLS